MVGLGYLVCINVNMPFKFINNTQTLLHYASSNDYFVPSPHSHYSHSNHAGNNHLQHILFHQNAFFFSSFGYLIIPFFPLLYFTLFIHYLPHTIIILSFKTWQ